MLKCKTMISCHRRPYYLLSESAKDEFIDGTAEDSGPFDSVIVGLAPSLFTYQHLNIAFRVLMNEPQSPDTPSPSGTNPSIPLIATHKAKYIRSSDGALSLGPGPFVTALENAAGVKAEIVGKPSRNFFEAVIRDFRDDSLLDESGGRIALIGDDIESDLGGGAVELQMWRILG
jgi:ribonucleotide monophosphatase NagD (HAD superfamily)